MFRIRYTATNNNSHCIIYLTLSKRRPLRYRNQLIDLRSKSMNWFLYDDGLRLERVNVEYNVSSYK